jgi:hypothetical protein
MATKNIVVLERVLQFGRGSRCHHLLLVDLP